MTILSNPLTFEGDKAGALALARIASKGVRLSSWSEGGRLIRPARRSKSSPANPAPFTTGELAVCEDLRHDAGFPLPESSPRDHVLSTYPAPAIVAGPGSCRPRVCSSRSG
jgi:hypothetical protein